MTLGIVLTLLNGTGTVWAAETLPITTTTITHSNNSSSETSRYNNISVSSGTRNNATAITTAGSVYVTDGAVIASIGVGDNRAEPDKSIRAFGISNSVMDVAGKGNVNIITNAIGGNATNPNGGADVGVQVLNVGAIYNDNTIKGTVNINGKATGGKATASNSQAEVYAVGMVAFEGGNNVVEGDTSVTIDAVGGKAVASNSQADTYAIGIGALGGNNIINGDAVITVKAIGGEASDSANVSSAGLVANNGINTIHGNVIITTDVTPFQTGTNFYAHSLYAASDGTLNSLNDLSEKGKLTQLQGDVMVEGEGSTNKIVMDTSESYLRGNLLQGTSLGTNDITIAKSAVWQPVYDNRYGSYFDETKLDTFVKSYSVNNIVTTANDNINLSNGGIIDLTWDGWNNGVYSPLTGRSSGYRNLTLNSLSGTGGIFRIDTDIAKGKADKITLNSADNNSAMQVQVNYDPYFATRPNIGDTLVAKDGGVGVIDGVVASNIVVTGAESEYNAYKFTPTVAWNLEKNQWEITSIATKYAPTANVMTAADSNYVKNLIWYADTNSVNQRLVELRGTKLEDGIWTRYGQGKLKNSSGRKAELKYNMFQVGYDKLFSEENGNKVYRGVVVTHTKGDTSYETGSGEAKYTNLALYQTWLGKSGDYYDAILKYGRISNDYNMTDISNNYSTADYAASAWTLSGEYGKKFTLGNVYIEPNAELILGHIGSTDYLTSKGMKVKVDSSKHAIMRFGFNLGKEFKATNAYFKANYYHDFAGDGEIVADNVSYARDGFKNWVELGLGGTVIFDNNINAYAEVNKYFGDMKSDLIFNVGLRYSF